MKVVFFACLLMLCHSWTGFAQSTESFPFLNIGHNAHMLGIADAVTAVNTGAASVFSNPANLALSGRSNLNANLNLWFSDLQIRQASAMFKSNQSTYAIAVMQSSVDGIEVRNFPGDALGTFSTQAFALAGSYARKMGFLHAGVTASYLFENFYQQNASGYFITAGLTAEFLDERLRFGASLRNLGRMQALIERPSRIPTNARFGVDAQLIQFSTAGTSEIPIVFSTSFDVVVPFEKSEQSGNQANLNDFRNPFALLGIRTKVSELLDFRTGYEFSNAARGFTFGTGIYYKDYAFDFSYIPFETGFGNGFSVGMRYFFD